MGAELELLLVAEGSSAGLNLDASGFIGADGQLQLVPPMDGGSSRWRGYLGIGAPPDAGRLTEVAARVAARLTGFSKICLRSDADLETRHVAAAMAEGLDLGAHLFKERDRAAPTLEIEGAQTDVERGHSRAKAINWARDIINAPPSEMFPEAVAELAQQAARKAGVQCRIWTAGELESEGFGAIVGVGRGSVHPPCLVELRTCAHPKRAFVGKGITFDSGGIDIKTDREQLWRMKVDLSGGCSVMAATFAAASLDLDADLLTLVPLAENLPGPNALLAGDVVRHPDGTTTEVVSTDAEGRLVVADAIAYAVREEVGEIVDAVTFSGPYLGERYWAVFGNDDGLVARLLGAGREGGDHGWRLPLAHEYRDSLRSTVADRRNGDFHRRHHDILVSALYLSDFVRATSWAHIDFPSRPSGSMDEVGDGPIGSPMRALITFLEDASSSAAAVIA